MFSSQGNEEAQIIARVLSGEREAFGFLVKRHLPVVYAVAYARTHNHADAEDVAQEAFLSALQSLDRLREPRKFVAWTVSIARRVAVDTFKAKARRSGAAPLPVDEEDPRPAVERRELFALVDRQLGELDEASREVILLHYFSGKDGREIAQLLGVSHGAVRKRLQRAREALGERILREVGAPRDVKAMLARPGERISCAALAVPVAWKAGVAGAAVGATGVGVAMWAKAGVGLAIALAAGAALWFQVTRSNPPVSASKTAVEASASASPGSTGARSAALLSDKRKAAASHDAPSAEAPVYPSTMVEDADQALRMLKEIDYAGGEDGCIESEEERWQHYIGRVEELLAQTSEPEERARLKYCLTEACKISKAYEKLFPLYEEFLGSEEFALLDEALRAQALVSSMAIYFCKYTNGNYHEIEPPGREKLEQLRQLAEPIQVSTWLGIPAKMAVRAIYSVATNPEPRQAKIEDRFIADLVLSEDVFRASLRESDAARAVMPGLNSSGLWGADLIYIYELPEFQPYLEGLAASDPELYLHVQYYVAASYSGDFPDKAFAIALPMLQELSARDPYCGWFYEVAATAAYRQGNFTQCMAYLQNVNNSNSPPRHTKGYWSAPQIRKRALSGGR